MNNARTIAAAILLISIFAFSFQTRAQELSGSVDHLVYFPIHVLHDGQVLNVHASEGDIVAQGALLIEMDAVVQTALVDARKSHADRLSIELKAMEAQYERDTEMFDRGSMSLLAYENAENALKLLRAQLSAARSQMQIARHELDQTRIYAPFDAIVLKRKVHPGMNIKSDTRKRPLMVLGSANQFVARFDLDHANWAELKKSGIPRHVTVNGSNYAVEADWSSFYYKKTKEGVKYIAKFGFADRTGEAVPGLSAAVAY